MLDKDGYVSETNDVNLFMVYKGQVYTPYADSCLPGITRSLVIQICQNHNIPVQEKRLSLTEFYTADEVFTSGTMGELTQVNSIDGRLIQNRSGKVVLAEIAQHFRTLTETIGEPLPF
jgi:branched-chain amino acid aminotransferase